MIYFRHKMTLTDELLLYGQMMDENTNEIQTNWTGLAHPTLVE
jgi:hypothetical protein